MVIIVGAGPSGIATSACLNKLSIPNILLEREDCFASLWQYKTYDRLHLNLPKQFCELPHMSYPADYPKYVTKNQFIQYLDNYVSEFNVKPLYNRCVESAHFDETAGKWCVKARNRVSNEIEEYTDEFLVVASGESCDAHTPYVNGIDTFRGETIHATQYKNGKSYENKRVLVVGCGNSGFEIALDLANFGAKTSIVIRNPLHVLNKTMASMSIVLLKYFPDNILLCLDSLYVKVTKMLYGDIRCGITIPDEGPLYQVLNYGKASPINHGTLEKIESGEIQVLPNINIITGENVEFTNGNSHAFDLIVFATGFKRSTNTWLKDTFLLDQDGVPKKRFPNNWEGQNGLYCAGLGGRGFVGIANDSPKIAKDIKKLIQS